ncbi:MAG TPA: rubrerythrin family protein [Candidatus Marinimicrobia bacterium]|nr:rubrerythrin family protein [Candidatus Neomarinimicrobiota bacterium]
MISETVRNTLLQFQKNEITEYYIYKKLAASIKDENNRRILGKIADDEKRHYETWKTYTGADLKPSRWKVWKYYLIARALGITFGIKLMEKGEGTAQINYHELGDSLNDAKLIAQEELAHEEALIAMIDEERLKYVGSVVLGLNDALVELTGALAGFTLALQNGPLIALTGSITGIAAALSMAASEYLSTKAEKTDKHPVKASIYTGIAYICTVILLILPYLFLNNIYLSLGISLTAAIVVIAVFNYYISVAKDEPFANRFWEMTILSLSVALFSFFIAFLLRQFLGIEI